MHDACPLRLISATPWEYIGYIHMDIDNMIFSDFSSVVFSTNSLYGQRLREQPWVDICVCIDAG